MKRIITCMLILSAYSSITGQENNNQEFGFNKGDFTISGSINYTNNKTSNQSIELDDFSENKRNLKSINLLLLSPVHFAFF